MQHWSSQCPLTLRQGRRGRSRLRRSGPTYPNYRGGQRTADTGQDARLTQLEGNSARENSKDGSNCKP